MPILGPDGPRKETGILALSAPTPDTLDVLSGVPVRTGLSFISAGGGIMRAIGDMIGSETIADLGGEVARTARGASEASQPPGMNLGQEILSSGAESALQMLPALAVGPASLAMTGIGLAATQQAGERYAELRDKGFSGGRSALHAAIDGLAEGLGEMVSLPVLAKTTKPFLDKLVHFMARDLVGEEFTTTMQSANALLSDRPDMTWGEFLNAVKMTALVTPVAAGLQTGMAHGIQRIRGDIQLPQTPPKDPVPPVPPVDAAPIPLPPAPISEPTTPTPTPPVDSQPTTPVVPEPPAPSTDGPTNPFGAVGFQPDPSTPFPSWTSQSGVKVYTTQNGYEVLGAMPDGSAVTLFTSQDSKEVSKFLAHRGYYTDLGQSWRWGAGHQHITEIDVNTGSETGYFLAPLTSKGGEQIGWTLYDPNGGMVINYPGELLADVLKKAQKDANDHFFSGGVTATPTPPQPKSPAPQYASPFQTTPAKITADSSTAPPELYNGMSGRANGRAVFISVIRNEGGNGYDVQITTRSMFGGMTTVFESRGMTAEEVHTVVAPEVGFDLRALPPDQLTTLHSGWVLREITANPGNLYQVSSEVTDLFGPGALETIAGDAVAKRAALGFDVEQWRDYTYAVTHRNMPGTMPVITPGRSTPQEMNWPALKALAPKTYFSDQDVKNSQFGAKALRILEFIRQRYVPDVTIIFRHDTRLHANGGMARLGNNVYMIQAAHLNSPARFFQVIKTLAHEMGHVITFQHFVTAAPSVQAVIIQDFLRMTKDVGHNYALNKYMTEHQLLPRKGPKDGDTIAHISNNDPDFMSYVMSFSEYIADQAAAHILLEDQVIIDQLMTEPEVVHFYGALLEKLRDLWSTFSTKFKLNENFSRFLYQIASNNGQPKATSYKQVPPAKNPPNAPPPPPRKAKYPKTQAQAELMSQRLALFIEQAHKAGIPLEELQAVLPTGLVKDADWPAILRLGDKYGIPRSSYDMFIDGKNFDDTTGFREQIFRANDLLNDADMKGALGEAAASVKSFNWIMQKTMTAVQLRKRFGDTVDGVKRFVDTLEKMFSYRSRWKEIADNRIKQMRGVPRAERERVFQLMIDEDADGDFKATIGVDSKGNRTYTLSPETISAYKLTEMGINLYVGMRTDFHNALEEMENEAVEELYRLYRTDVPALRKAEAELRHGFDLMKAKPYVPHTRFGNYTVSVREPGGVLREFYQFESERDAKKMEGRLRNEYGKTAFVSRGVMTEQMRLMMGLPPQLVNAMKTQLQLTDKQIGEFENILKDMSNGASFVRRFKKRKNVAGWESDAAMLPRAYADYMSRFANHISRIRYNYQLTDAVSAVRGQATLEARNGVNTMELNELANWLNRLQSYVNDPGTEFSNARAAATIWYLGVNVKSALVNSTSVPLVSVPYLSKRFGNTKTIAGITQAYKDIAKKYVRQQALTDDEKKMLEYLRTIGRIDASFASELAGLREGGRLSDQTALSKPAAAFFGIKYWAMLPFQKIEVVNREVTALAAYRLARTTKQFNADDPQGFDKKAAEFASSAVQDTQNENAQWNRAEFMRGKKSILTMFMSYQQNIMYQMFGGDEAWLRLLAVQLMAAGIMGLPFAQDIDDLIKWFARKVFGSDISAEKALRAYFRDTIGSDWALQGASHNIGGLNLQGSLSQGRVIPGIDALTMEGNFNDRLANAAGDVGGAGFSIIMNILKTVASNDPDKVTAATRAIPEFARALVEGGKMLSEGKALDGKGNELTQVTEVEALARMAGFQITNVTQERAKRFAQKDSAQYWITRRGYVLALYDKAMETRDPEWRDKANEALREFNSEAPDSALKITGEQLRESIHRRAVSHVRADRNLGPSNTQTQTYRRVGELYQ